MISCCIFTSPISSNPSLEVIKKCISSFPAFLNSYIFCDGYKLNENRRFRNKFGQVNQKEADNYEQFKKNLKEFKNFKVLEATRWFGYAKMLKFAVNLIDTRYIFVIQHDWELKSKLDICEIEKDLEENDVHYLVLRSKLVNYDENLKLVGLNIIPFLKDCEVAEIGSKTFNEITERFKELDNKWVQKI